MLTRMGFGDLWFKWMKDLVFSSLMLVLVNGSLTKDFEMGKGFRQGGPLSFFFVSCERFLVKKAYEIEEFTWFSMEGKCEVDILQLADDTLLVGEGN